MANVAIFPFYDEIVLSFHENWFQFDQLTVFIDKTTQNSIANIFVFVSNTGMYIVIIFLLNKSLKKLRQMHKDSNHDKMDPDL